MRRMLQFSLLLNALLFGVVWWRRTSRMPMPRIPRSQVGQPARNAVKGVAQPEAAVPGQAMPWAGIEASDPAQFVINLRAIGCPEQTIRDIVVLRVSRSCGNRLVEMEAKAARSRDYRKNRDARDWRESNWQRTDLRNEMISTVETLFDQTWGSITSSLLGWQDRGNNAEGFLSVDSRREIRELDQRYGRLTEDLGQRCFTGQLDAEDSARLRELDRQKQAELAGILSPQQLEEYLNRRSPAADYVRQNLPAAKSESEFRSVVKLAQEFELSRDPASVARRMGLGIADESVARDFEERKAAFDERVKELLGQERIAEQQAEEQMRVENERKQQQERDDQRERTRIADLAAAVDVGAEDANRFFDRLKEMQPLLQPKLEEMEKTLTGTPVEKEQKLKIAVKAEFEKIAVETMGEKGRALVEKLLKQER